MQCHFRRWSHVRSNNFLFYLKTFESFIKLHAMRARIQSHVYDIILKHIFCPCAFSFVVVFCILFLRYSKSDDGLHIGFLAGCCWLPGLVRMSSQELCHVICVDQWEARIGKNEYWLLKNVGVRYLEVEQQVTARTVDVAAVTLTHCTIEYIWNFKLYLKSRVIRTIQHVHLHLASWRRWIIGGVEVLHSILYNK